MGPHPPGGVFNPYIPHPMESQWGAKAPTRDLSEVYTILSEFFMHLYKSYTAYFAYFTYSLHKIIHWVLGNPIGAPLGWVLKGNPPMGPHQGLDPTHGLPHPPGPHPTRWGGAQSTGRGAVESPRWSLSLSHLRYYGDPMRVKSNDDMSRVNFLQLHITALEGMFANWGISRPDMFHAINWTTCFWEYLNHDLSESTTGTVHGGALLAAWACGSCHIYEMRQV
jgi:hypothetical protein